MLPRPALANVFALLTIALGVYTPASAQDLIAIEPSGGFTAAELDGRYRGYGLAPATAIVIYHVRYTMSDFRGGTDTVSALLAVPTDASARYPTAVYMHGTSDDKFDVPSRGRGGADPAYMLAGQGYAVAAPDYLGLGDSGNDIHAYHHARSEAMAGIRLLEALAEAPAYAAAVNAQLFLTGYSQGGHASMAMHEVLTEEYPDVEVTAAAPMSGPYSISGVMLDSVVLADESYLAVGLMPYLVLAYQELDPTLPGTLADIFRARYLPAIEAFRDGFVSGASSYRALTQSLLQTYVATTGSAEVYPYRLLTPDFERRLREGDADDPWLLALRQNDPYDFDNPTPTRLLYCRADEQADYRNALLARDSMRARGAPDVEAVDVGRDLDHGACFAPAIAAMVAFFADYQQIASSSPETRAPIWEVTASAEGLAFRFGAGGPHRVAVFDGLGRRLAARTFRESGVISVGTASSAILIARVTDPDGRTSARVVLP